MKNEIWKAITDALKALGKFEIIEGPEGLLLKQMPDVTHERFLIPRPQAVNVAFSEGGADARDKRPRH